MNTDSRLIEIISAFKQNGHKAYLVGGCVRDMLRGEAPHDYDIASSLPPDGVASLFPGCKIIETGIEHGTVTLIYKHLHTEITTFRRESGYSDKRHPDRVEFVGSIEDDLARRDFTVNAMAYDPCEDRLVDPWGGREDIAARRIVCVGEPHKRFDEDALRVLRALRFSSVLSFEIEEKTSAAALSAAEQLKFISGERIFTEIRKMLAGADIERVIVSYYRILAHILPQLSEMAGFEQHNRHHIYDILEHTAKVVAACPQNDETLRLAALLHDTGKPECFTTDKNGVGHFKGHPEKSAEIAQDFFRRMKSDKKTAREVAELVRYHDERFSSDRAAVRPMLVRFGKKGFSRLMKLKRADNSAQNPDFDYSEEYNAVERTAAELLSENICLNVSEMSIGGEDLISLNYTGEDIGRMLSRIFMLVTTEALPDERQVLLDYAARNMPTD